MTDREKKIERWLTKEVPELDTSTVWCIPSEREIFPVGPQSKANLAALHAAGYEWCGRWWSRPFTEDEMIHLEYSSTDLD